MLNPADITDAVVAQLKNISELADAMSVANGHSTTVRITSFHYQLGAEYRLAEAIYKMPAPSILVAWEGTQGGNFDGQTMWKHTIAVYLRMGNAAGASAPVGYEKLWWMICNRPPQGSTVNLRYMNVLPGLDIMDTPSVLHILDEDLMDMFRGVLIFPEIGDN